MYSAEQPLGSAWSGRAVGEEEEADLDGALLRGDEERHRAVRLRELRLRPRAEQQLDDLEVAVRHAT